MSTSLDASHEPALVFGHFRFLPRQKLLTRHNVPLRLGSRAREILSALLEDAGKVVMKADLIAHVWPRTIVEEGVLRVHIASLRRVLDDNARVASYIETVNGHGYRFVGRVSRAGWPPAALLGQHVKQSPVDCPPIGRDSVIELIAAQLPQKRFITVVGGGGVGKSLVAAAVAAKIRSAYPDGVHTLNFDVGRDCAEIDWPTGQSLVFIDNCEQALDAAAKYAETLLRAAPGIHVLATSREPLRACNENLIRLRPLGFPQSQVPLTAAQAMRYPAVRLFVELATAASSSFTLTDLNAAAVSDICRQLDGLPLALELAAARVRTLGLRGIQTRLGSVLSLLTHGRRTAHPRQQTLRASLDASYSSLSPLEQATLCRLSVLDGSFDIDGAIALLEEQAGAGANIVELIAALADKSLLMVDACVEPTRFRLLNTSRAYALERRTHDNPIAQAAASEFEALPPADVRRPKASRVRMRSEPL